MLASARDILEKGDPAHPRLIVSIVPKHEEPAPPPSPQSEVEALKDLLDELSGCGFLPCDQTVQCAGCGAIWWSQKEKVHQNWHAEGCVVFRAQLAAGRSNVVDERVDPAPESFSPWLTPMDALVKEQRGALEARLRAEYEGQLEALRKRAEADRAAIRELIELAWIPADQTIVCPGCGAGWWMCEEEVNENWHAPECPVFSLALGTGYTWGERELPTVDVRRGPAPTMQKPWSQAYVEGRRILNDRAAIEARAEARLHKAQGAAKAVLWFAMLEHPWPWRVEHDWTYDIRAADNKVVAKCQTPELAADVLALAEDVHALHEASR